MRLQCFRYADFFYMQLIERLISILFRTGPVVVLMELQRPRKMELLHTPKSELVKMLRENAIDIDDALFLCASNKVIPGDIRSNSPSLCDRLLGLLLKHWFSSSPSEQQEVFQHPSIQPQMAA